MVVSKWPYVDFSPDWVFTDKTCYICHRIREDFPVNSIVCDVCIKRDSEYIEKMKLKLFRRPQVQKGESRISDKEMHMAFERNLRVSFLSPATSKDTVSDFFYLDDLDQLAIESRCLLTCHHCSTEYYRIMDESQITMGPAPPEKVDEFCSDREKEIVKRYTEWFLSHQSFDEDVELDFYRVINPTPEVKILCVDCANDYSVEPISPKSADLEKSNRTRRISTEVQNQVWRRDEGRCVQCDSNENLEFDHIIPFSKGGSNNKRNIQLLCESCNRKKSDNIGS